MTQRDHSQPTPAFLFIKDIIIPEDNGGLFLNGIEVVNNSDIQEQNNNNTEGLPSAGTAQFSSIPNNATSTDPVINISNTFDPGLYPNEDYVVPDIIVEGRIENLGGDVNITNLEGGFKTGKDAQILAKNQNISVGGGVFIGEVARHNIDGDPMAEWNEYLDNGTSAATPGDINAILANPGANRPANLYGDSIIINAEFLNVNGVIQSGRADYNLILNAQAITDIEEIRNSPQQGLVELTDLASTDFRVYYDTEHDRIQVQEVRVSGGHVVINSHVMNTGHGEIRVLGGYGNINIVNETPYDILVNRLDVSTRGDGTLESMIRRMTAQPSSRRKMEC